MAARRKPRKIKGGSATTGGGSPQPGTLEAGKGGQALPDPKAMPGSTPVPSTTHARAEPGERSYADWEGQLTVREKRVEEVLGLMARGSWLAGVSDKVLAKNWGCDPATVRAVAAEANRLIRLRLREDPQAKLDIRASLLTNFEAIRAKAMLKGDAPNLRVALDALRAYGFYLGIEPAKRLDVTERHDPFEGWTTEEKLAYSRDGRRPRRAVTQLAAEETKH